MEEQDIKDAKEEVGELVKKLLSLVPPYDKISMFLKDCQRSGKLHAVSEAHKEFFDIRVFTTLQTLLGLEINKNGRISAEYHGIGNHLSGLITAIHSLFDNDEYRERISEFTGIQIPNAFEEYIKGCIDEIGGIREIKEIIKILLDESYHDIDEIRGKLEEKDIRIDGYIIGKYLDDLLRLGIVSEYYPGSGRYCINNEAKRYIHF